MRRLHGIRKPQTPGKKQRSSGVTTVELSIVMMVFLTMVFGMLELSVAVFQYHVVSQAARHGARLASVRGELADVVGKWNPSMGNPYSVLLSVNDPVANAVRQYTAGIVPAQTTVTLSWPDGTNALESPVQFQVQTVHQPFLTILFTSNWTLTGRSIMPINH